MFARFMIWFGLIITSIAAVGAPTRAAAPHHTRAQAPFTDRIYVPMVLANAGAGPTVRLLSHRDIRDEEGNFQIVGEVVNDIARPVYLITLEATFYDAAGGVVAANRGFTLLNQTRTDQRNPFIITSGGTATAARYDVRVVEWQTSSARTIQPLTVVSQYPRNDGLELFGEVRNTGTQTVQSPSVVATLRDAAGNVVDVIPGRDLTPGRIGKRELAPNSTSVYQLSSQSTTYATATVQAEAYVAETPSPAFNLRIPSRRDIVQEAEGQRDLVIVGEVINQSVATAYDIGLEARFFNSANQLVAVTSGNAYLGRTTTNQRNPFTLFLANAPATIVPARTQLIATAYSTGVEDYRPVTVVSDDDAQTPYGTDVTGQLRNDQTVPLISAYPVATFYDAAGNVVDVTYGYADQNDALGERQPIQPSSEVPYIASSARKITYEDYTVQAEGYPRPLVAPSPAPSADPAHADREQVIQHRAD